MPLTRKAVTFSACQAARSSRTTTAIFGGGGARGRRCRDRPCADLTAVRRRRLVRSSRGRGAPARVRAGLGPARLRRAGGVPRPVRRPRLPAPHARRLDGADRGPGRGPLRARPPRPRDRRAGRDAAPAERRPRRPGGHHGGLHEAGPVPRSRRRRPRSDRSRGGPPDDRGPRSGRGRPLPSTTPCGGACPCWRPTPGSPSSRNGWRPTCAGRPPTAVVGSPAGPVPGAAWPTPPATSSTPTPPGPSRSPPSRRRVGASPTHLVRAFTRRFGLPPHAYLVARRVEAAAGCCSRAGRRPTSPPRSGSTTRPT